MFPLIGFFIKIMQDFINIFIPNLNLNLAPFFPYILIVLMNAELIKIALAVSKGKKIRLEISDIFGIKSNILNERTSFFYLIIAFIVYWSLFALLSGSGIPFAIRFPISAIAIYLSIRWLFYGFFIFDEEKVCDEEKVGPFKALKMSSEITRGAFWYLVCFILIVVIVNCIFASVISMVITLYYAIFYPQLSETSILEFTCIAPIISVIFSAPIVIIAQSGIYHSLKAQTQSRPAKPMPPSPKQKS